MQRYHAFLSTKLLNLVTSIFIMVNYPSHPGLEAEILVEGQALTEYRADNEAFPLNTVTRYVEATHGSRFSVRFVVPKTCWADNDLAATLTMDGVEVRTQTKRRHADGRRDWDCTTEFSVSRVQGNDLKQYFHFNQLDKADNTGPVDDALKAHIMSKGRIELQLHRIRNLRSMTPTNVDSLPLVLPSPVTVPEEATKGSALSHVTSLSPAEPVSKISWKECEYIDGPKRPVAAFRFEYRSRGMRFTGEWYVNEG